MLWTQDAKRDLHEELTLYRLFQDWRSQSETFAEMAIFGERAKVLTGESPERVVMAYMSANLIPLLVGVVLIACLIPARRAAKVDPMIALRCE